MSIEAVTKHEHVEPSRVFTLTDKNEHSEYVMGTRIKKSVYLELFLRKPICFYEHSA